MYYILYNKYFGCTKDMYYILYSKYFGCTKGMYCIVKICTIYCTVNIVGGLKICTIYCTVNIVSVLKVCVLPYFKCSSCTKGVYSVLYHKGPSWSWLYGSLIYNYMCNRCLSQLTLWVWTPFIVRCTGYNIMW